MKPFVLRHKNCHQDVMWQPRISFSNSWTTLQCFQSCCNNNNNNNNNNISIYILKDFNPRPFDYWLLFFAWARRGMWQLNQSSNNYNNNNNNNNNKNSNNDICRVIYSGEPYHQVINDNLDCPKSKGWTNHQKGKEWDLRNL